MPQHYLGSSSKTKGLLLQAAAVQTKKGCEGLGPLLHFSLRSIGNFNLCSGKDNLNWVIPLFAASPLHLLTFDIKVSFLNFSSRITHTVFICLNSFSCPSWVISLYTISSNVLFLKTHKNFYSYRITGFIFPSNLSVI